MACKIFPLYLWRVKFLDNCDMAMKCACCGGEMMPDKDIGSSIIYKCTDCGLSDTKLKEVEEKATARDQD
jgi:hypothetical protein